MFRDANELAACYPDLVRHAMTNFDSHDVMRFLGKRLTTLDRSRHPCDRRGDPTD